jgi:hypothetical protein
MHKCKLKKKQNFQVSWICLTDAGTSFFSYLLKLFELNNDELFWWENNMFFNLLFLQYKSWCIQPLTSTPTLLPFLGSSTRPPAYAGLRRPWPALDLLESISSSPSSICYTNITSNILTWTKM